MSIDPRLQQRLHQAIDEMVPKLMREAYIDNLARTLQVTRQHMRTFAAKCGVEFDDLPPGLRYYFFEQARLWHSFRPMQSNPPYNAVIKSPRGLGLLPAKQWLELNAQRRRLERLKTPH